MDFNTLLQEFTNLQDLTSSFSMIDVVVGLSLSFILISLIGLVYEKTHKGTSYTQSYVHTLIIMGMVITIIMLIVGSNIARAFSLVGALSIVRFRNAMKETRDIGFIFLAMAIGMAMGTKFYLLGIFSTGFILSAIIIMHKFDWFAKPITSQILKVQVENNLNFETIFDDVFAKYTTGSELISLDTVRGGALTELVYSVNMESSVSKQEFLAKLKTINGNQKISLITGYNSTDL
ncbi:DUF4956 domain-containing protein [Candidatus Gracilibacteria bacterium]|nr:DUF4956 domain-containing protein [Candidatus Gracilibacteria bacterium]